AGWGLAHLNRSKPSVPTPGVLGFVVPESGASSTHLTADSTRPCPACGCPQAGACNLDQESRKNPGISTVTMSDLDIAEGMSDIAALQQARRRFGALNGYRPPQR